MEISLLRTNEEISDIYDKYADMVYRIAIMILKNTADAEDATQSVFVKLMRTPGQFAGDEHLKAWLITVTQNTCRDMVKSWWRSKRSDIDSAKERAYMPLNTERDIWEKVMGLHDKYKLPVYLYYYEGYDTEQISRMLKVKHAMVRTRLRAARKKLKLVLEEEQNEEKRVKY